ncbi:hypothetical protein [Gluconobacter thailandicus]|uniref:Uncharacterized protein n=1 Tax=Gluconobacter thailandicus TaxID=257438 RepID=A0AAP9EPE0_GLUTH|nr:hypothetical protein [Gluconobacter thailandicus]QEH94919.1 hypothetical protein FXF46_00555 [Gluconobacter thailandicus]
MPHFSSDIPSFCKAMGKPDFRYHSFNNIASIPQTPYVKVPVGEAEHAEASASITESAVTLCLQDVRRGDTALPIENSLTQTQDIPLSRVFSVLEQNKIASGTSVKKLNEIFR